jgi:quercetin dioxygenase-like cupin family protein
MEITPATETATRPANPDYFTGTVWQEPILTTPAAPEVMLVRVLFAPGGRTNWHTHPCGQTLYVLEGEGRIQRRGEPVRRIVPGDTVWIPPGEEHWHGAAPGRAMAHIAMQAMAGGRTADWLEPVSEADYAAEPA